MKYMLLNSVDTTNKDRRMAKHFIRVSINELVGLLGHSTPKITLEQYASVIEAKSINLGDNFSLFSAKSDTILPQSNLEKAINP